VGAFSVEYAAQGGWSKFGSGTSIGMGRILKADSAVTTDRVRIQVTETLAPPAIAEMELFQS
jgi:hypothetical protein